MATVVVNTLWSGFQLSTYLLCDAHMHVSVSIRMAWRIRYYSRRSSMCNKFV